MPPRAHTACRTWSADPSCAHFVHRNASHRRTSDLPEDAAFVEIAGESGGSGI